MLKSPPVIAAIVVVVLIFLVWLFTRGSKRLRAWIHEPVEPGKPRWTYALTPLAAALAPMAAFSVLLPNYFNQQQSDRKFMAEADRSRTDAEWQRTRLDTDARAAEFIAVQSRFGSAEQKTRAVAALQLADLALLPKPSADGDDYNNANYPQIGTTAAQLAVALRMEDDPAVRTAYREAIRKMVAFATAAENPEWQITIANHLATTNRYATKAFTESLGRYGAVHNVSQPNTLQVLASVAPFTSVSDATMIALRDLTTTQQFQADRRIAGRLRAARTGELRTASDAALLSEVQSSGLRLIDTRDILADSLRALKLAPAPTATVNLLEETKPSSRAAVLKLTDCFLAGANLWEASLRGADVAGANFTEANLKHTDLTGVNVEKAVHLPRSVTKSDQGPDSERLPALRQKYPHFDWEAVETRTAKPSGAEKTP